MSRDAVARVDLDIKVNPAELNARQRAAVLAGLRHAAEEIRTYAQQLTPKDKGVLRASAEVVIDRDEAVAAISYNTEYAVYQHERLDLHHPVGEAKFLEKAMLAKAEDAQAILAKYLREAFK
ncbi:HK97 gp10 family phage protein [Streptosporangium sp. NPDC020072]|uniref:HK97 gp10 family phage protein n=1 Tax=Streptosporangium sp. NPDC020072 TaxID=3154788 RepID=UPI003438330B